MLQFTVFQPGFSRRSPGQPCATKLANSSLSSSRLHSNKLAVQPSPAWTNLNHSPHYLNPSIYTQNHQRVKHRAARPTTHRIELARDS